MSPLSVSAALDLCNQKADAQDASAQQGALRCLRRLGGRFELVPYTDDQAYVAISYCWPADEFLRRDSSKEGVDIYQDDRSIHSNNFTRFMEDALAPYSDRDGLGLWLDYHCINQSDIREKVVQMAAMDTIFSNAAFTAVMLEDVGISSEEFEVLKRQNKSLQGDRHSRIVRRIMSARLFTRAWCSQESLLSRKATVFVHHTDKPTKPIAFGFGTLRSWVDLAGRGGFSLPRLYQPLAVEGPHEGTFTVIKSFAWAYGVVIHQNCLNVYDKVSLTLNLMRLPANKHVINLPVADTDRDDSKGNVTRILNTLAIEQRDYSLLQVCHYDQRVRWPSSSDHDFPRTGIIDLSPSFTWAGIPISGDRVSERWHAQKYDVSLDLEAHVSDKGLTVKGLMAQVQDIRRWKIERTGERLNVWVGEERTVVKSKFLQSRSSLQKVDQAMQTLHDIVYAVEALDAAEVFKFFVPTGGNWEVPNYVIRDNIRGDAVRRFVNPAHKYQLFATAISCLEQGGVIRFDELRLQDTIRRGGSYIPAEYVLVTNHSPLLQHGHILFQPYIMRPKLINNDTMTSNMMVLPSNALGHDVIGPTGVAKFIEVFPSLVNLRSVQMQLSPVWCRHARRTIC